MTIGSKFRWTLLLGISFSIFFFFFCIAMYLGRLITSSIVNSFGYVIPTLNLEEDLDAIKIVIFGASGIFLIIAYMYVDLSERIDRLAENKEKPLNS